MLTPMSQLQYMEGFSVRPSQPYPWCRPRLQGIPMEMVCSKANFCLDLLVTSMSDSAFSMMLLRLSR